MKEILRAEQRRLLRFYLLILLAITLAAAPCYLWLQREQQRLLAAPVSPLTAQAAETHEEGQFTLGLSLLPAAVLEVQKGERVAESYHLVPFEGKMLIVGLHGAEKGAASPAARFSGEQPRQLEGWVRTVHHEILSAAMEHSGLTAGEIYPFMLEEHTVREELGFVRRVFWLPFGGAYLLWAAVAAYGVLLVRLRREFVRPGADGAAWDRFVAGYQERCAGQKGGFALAAQGWLYLRSADRFFAVNLWDVCGVEARSLGRGRRSSAGAPRETLLKLYRPDKRILNIDLGRGFDSGPLLEEMNAGCPWLLPMEEDENREAFKKASAEQLEKELEGRRRAAGAVE